VFGTSVKKNNVLPPSRVLQMTIVSTAGSDEPGMVNVTTDGGIAVEIVYSGDAVDMCPVCEPVGGPNGDGQSGGAPSHVTFGYAGITEPTA
jgi:hypothetical protein